MTIDELLEKHPAPWGRNEMNIPRDSTFDPVMRTFGIVDGGDLREALGLARDIDDPIGVIVKLANAYAAQSARIAELEAGRDDLQRRLDALVKFLEEEWHNTDAADVAGYYRTELSTAIEAAKGGK
jgi:hypothetical protein